jgi:hypothetical protein
MKRIKDYNVFLELVFNQIKLETKDPITKIIDISREHLLLFEPYKARIGQLPDGDNLIVNGQLNQDYLEEIVNICAKLETPISDLTEMLLVDDAQNLERRTKLRMKWSNLEYEKNGYDVSDMLKYGVNGCSQCSKFIKYVLDELNKKYHTDKFHVNLISLTFEKYKKSTDKLPDSARHMIIMDNQGILYDPRRQYHTIGFIIENDNDELIIIRQNNEKRPSNRPEFERFIINPNSKRYFSFYKK